MRGIGGGEWDSDSGRVASSSAVWGALGSGGWAWGLGHARAQAVARASGRAHLWCGLPCFCPIKQTAPNPWALTAQQASRSLDTT